MAYETPEELEEGRERLLGMLLKVRQSERKNEPPDVKALQEFIDLAEDLLANRPEEFAEVKPYIEQVRNYIDTHGE